MPDLWETNPDNVFSPPDEPPDPPPSSHDDHANEIKLQGRGRQAPPPRLAVLELVPTPEQGRRLTRAAVRRALVSAGRRRSWPRPSQWRPPTARSLVFWWPYYAA